MCWHSCRLNFVTVYPGTVHPVAHQEGWRRQNTLHEKECILRRLKYPVILTAEDKNLSERVVKPANHARREIQRAPTLLRSTEGKMDVAVTRDRQARRIEPLTWHPLPATWQPGKPSIMPLVPPFAGSLKFRRHTPSSPACISN